MVMKKVICPEVRVNTKLQRKKKNGGSGFLSKGRYWSKVPNALKRINTQRHLQFLERKRKSHCGKEDCKYWPPLAGLKPSESRSMSPAPSVARPSDHGFTRSKYVFRGYMADEEFTEVKPGLMNQEPRLLKVFS